MIRFIAMALLVPSMLVSAPPANARQDDPRLDGLFEDLLATTEPGTARAIEAAIWHVWLESGDERLDRVLSEGVGAMQAGNFPVALERFNAIVAQAPDFAEGWNKRATLYYLMGEYTASVADVERTLALEPRHFGALSGMGLILTALADDVRALDWFERALTVNPHMPAIRQRVEDLRKKLRGKPI